MKKIVLLNASPRPTGNSATLSAAFSRTIEAEGARLVRFDTASSGVKGCIACDNCFKDDKPCCFDDGFNAIIEEILSADALAISTPVYWYTFPAGIKAIIDKFYSLCVAGKSLEGKKCVLMSCCEDDDAAAFEGLVFSYEKSMSLLKCQDVGQLLIKNVHKIGDIHATDGEEQARGLAKKLLASM